MLTFWVKPVYQRATFCPCVKGHIPLIMHFVGTGVITNREDEENKP